MLMMFCWLWRLAKPHLALEGGPFLRKRHFLGLMQSSFGDGYDGSELTKSGMEVETLMNNAACRKLGK